MMWGATPVDQLLCRIRFKQAAYEGPYTPPALGKETVSWPGFMGSISWGSLAVDRQHQVFVVNTSHVATVAELVPRAEADKLGVAARGDPKDKHVRGYYAMAGTPYALKMGAFLSPLGLPCNQPPYGLISAVDYKDGRLLWTRWLGTAKDSDFLGHTLGMDIAMGVPNIGGGIVTKSGLIFISAAQEQVLRAIDIRTGKVLWKGRLPAGGQATPMTYLGADGRQYVAIAAGGKNLLKTKLGNDIVAFALPSPTVQ
jgi:quinoprotein glucose dehydrogenase